MNKFSVEAMRYHRHLKYLKSNKISLKREGLILVSYVTKIYQLAFKNPLS